MNVEPAGGQFGRRERRLSRRAKVGLSAAVAGILIAAAITGAVHVSARTQFEAAAAALLSATDAADTATEQLSAAADDGEAEVIVADAIIASAADDLVDVSARTAFADATSGLAASVDEAELLLADPPLPAPEVTPVWTWELHDAAPALDVRTAETTALVTRMDAAREALDGGGDRLVAAALPLYASVGPAAAALEAANVSARAFVLLDFREAGRAVTGQTGVGSGAAVAFTALAATAANLKVSQQTELAEKAGPLFETRLEIEAFARSLAGGVVLDFDWMPIVNGIGGSDGMGGTATWATVRGGFSTITLSNSVAQNWPSADAQALVAHEVGHSITSKCSTLFDSGNAAANETWATAWAISMGYTAIGNGIQAYGYPPQDMIDLAATCR